MVVYQNNFITVFQSVLFKTNSTVVHTPDVVIVVDPNWLPGEINLIRKFVDSVKGNKPLYLLFTHSDYDHIIGYNAFPEAKVIASKTFVENPEKEKILEQIRQFDDDYYIDRPYEIAYPQVHIPVTTDEFCFEAGQTKLHFFLAPGHNFDGIFTVIEPMGIFIAGDYFSDVEFPFIYYSGTEYSRTVKKAVRIFNDFKIKNLVPGHGSICNSKAEFLIRKKDSDQYLYDLMQSIITGKEFDLKSLFKKYKYPRLMKKFHEDNLTLMKAEIAKNKA